MSCSSPAPIIRVADDGSHALLLIPTGTDPGTLDCAALVRAAGQAGIELDEAAEHRIESAVEAFRRRPEESRIVIAQATPVEDGRDGEVEWLEGYTPVPGCLPIPRADGRGGVDHYNCVSYRRVREGDHVANLSQPTPGRNGADLGGRPVIAKPGQPCEIRFDECLRIEQDGRVVSLCDGLLQIGSNEVKVADVFMVEGDVDFSTGNIDFDGSVYVAGAVRDRFAVRATNDLIIGGLVQAAKLTCGRDLACERGMVGRGRGDIRVSGNAELRFLDGVLGSVGGDLTVRNELMNCTLSVGGCLQAAPAGVVGGTLTVGAQALVGRIGTPSGRATCLVLHGRGEVVLSVAQAICPGVRLEMGEFEVIFERLVNGPLRLGYDASGAIVQRLERGVLPLGDIAVVRTRAD